MAKDCDGGTLLFGAQRSVRRVVGHVIQQFVHVLAVFSVESCQVSCILGI